MTRIQTPTEPQLAALRVAGKAIGYSGAGIYVRYEAIIGALVGVPAKRVLVIGCGHGIFDRLLPDSSEVVGVDIGEEEIRTASAWAKEYRPQNRYLLGGVEDLTLDDGWADLTIASEVIEHMPEDEVSGFLKVGRRLTNPGGKVVVTVPNIRQLRNRARKLVRLNPVFMDPDHKREYDLESATATIESSGLTIESIHGAVLYGPMEAVIQKLIPARTWLRTSVAARWPTIASHLIFVCRP